MLSVRILQGWCLPGLGAGGPDALGALSGPGWAAKLSLSRGSSQEQGSQGLWAPACPCSWAQAKDGYGSTGGAPCLALWCPWQAQLNQLLREWDLPAAPSGAPPEAAGGRGSPASRLALSTDSQTSRKWMISGPFPRCCSLDTKNKGSVFMMAVSVVLRLPSARSYSELSGLFCAFSCTSKPLCCSAAFTNLFGWLTKLTLLSSGHRHWEILDFLDLWW